MKALKKFGLLGLVAPLLFSFLFSLDVIAAGEGKVVTIRVLEIPKSTLTPSRISIVEEGKIRNIDLLPFKWHSTEQDKNLETINNLIDQYLKAGFKIETSNAAYNGLTVISTYILTK